MADDPLSTLTKIVQQGTRVRLAPGVIGKSGMMWLGLLAVWVAAFIKMDADTPLLNAMLLGGSLIITGLVIRETAKMRDYAIKNPSTALLEGAEFVEYKKFEAQAKELPAGDTSRIVSATGEERLLSKGGEPQS